MTYIRSSTARWRAVAVVLFLLGTALTAGGCRVFPWQKSRQNVEHSKQLRVGMTKQEVLKIMGPPESQEEFNKPDLWWYYMETVWADGLITEDECMPLVFKGDKLIGWGRNFYTRYRIDTARGRSHGTKKKKSTSK